MYTASRPITVLDVSEPSFGRIRVPTWGLTHGVRQRHRDFANDTLELVRGFTRFVLGVVGWCFRCGSMFLMRELHRPREPLLGIRMPVRVEDHRDVAHQARSQFRCVPVFAPTLE